MKEIELKPCPFCGGEAKLMEISVCGGRDYSFIKCKSCGVRTPEYTVSVKICPNDEATKTWNRRATDEKAD